MFPSIMGLTITQTATIEILAPPSTVRSIFMNFKNFSTWQDVFTITPSASQAPSDLKKDDSVRVTIRNFPFNPTVESNTPESFVWVGSVPVLLYGTHHFIFAPSEKNPGGTTFTQREDFQGLAAVACWPWRSTFKPSEAWEAFNESLKKEAERVAGEM
ncbi:hypothetical protein F5X68DRAFT_235783 [Plectosphaerella plurivora]|uniref:Uncharacterized protein n=1 Tax=Plectosphaerella plurivora TaxID=936078 RepID=A0A9P8V429_9PEZI|nr:hypothetical protein F5X68DRAFT_235783 [Plectosphaerella plurivora]